MTKKEKKNPHLDAATRVSVLPAVAAARVAASGPEGARLWTRGRVVPA